MYYWLLNNEFRNPTPEQKRILPVLMDETDFYPKNPRYISITEEEAKFILTYQDEQLQIENSKEYLNNTDYKIIKCMEAYLKAQNLQNIDMPYDFNDLADNRQQMRDSINRIEAINF